MTVERLRWAIFTASVISSADNPEAHLWREIGKQLTERGQEAVFFEERGNPALRELLRRSGSQALTDFRSRYPEIEYRTLEPLSGIALAEWMTQTLATVDIAVAQFMVPNELVGWLAQFTRPHLQTFIVDSGWNHSPDLAPIEQVELADITGVLAGDAALADRFTVKLPASRVHRFGPLPARADLIDEQNEPSPALSSAARQVVEIVSNVSREIRRSRGSQMHPNGRTDREDRSAPAR